jgi:Transketolase, N-terminal subunit
MRISELNIFIVGAAIEMTETELKIFAEQIRLESIKSMASCGSGHVGGVLSIADLLAVLYGDILKINPSNPEKEDRDRVILSKGHCGPALYAALALKGYFPLSDLLLLNKNGSNLPSHCNRFHTLGVDACTGSLGQGGSIGAGIALGLKAKGFDSYVYVIYGDGECDEGQVWETALFAAHHRLIPNSLLIEIINNLMVGQRISVMLVIFLRSSKILGGIQ